MHHVNWNAFSNLCCTPCYLSVEYAHCRFDQGRKGLSTPNWWPDLISCQPLDFLVYQIVLQDASLVDQSILQLGYVCNLSFFWFTYKTYMVSMQALLYALPPRLHVNLLVNSPQLNTSNTRHSNAIFSIIFSLLSSDIILMFCSVHFLIDKKIRVYWLEIFCLAFKEV